MYELLISQSILPSGCLPVDQAHVTYVELMEARKSLVLSTELHLLFLTTPPDLASTIQPQWLIYFQDVRETLLPCTLELDRTVLGCLYCRVWLHNPDYNSLSDPVLQ